MQQAQLTWTKGLLRDDKGDVQVIDLESGWAFFSLFHQQHRDLVCQLINQLCDVTCNRLQVSWIKRVLCSLYGSTFFSFTNI